MHTSHSHDSFSWVGCNAFPSHRFSFIPAIRLGGWHWHTHWSYHRLVWAVAQAHTITHPGTASCSMTRPAARGRLRTPDSIKDRVMRVTCTIRVIGHQEHWLFQLRVKNATSECDELIADLQCLRPLGASAADPTRRNVLEDIFFCVCMWYQNKFQTMCMFNFSSYFRNLRIT